MILIHPDLNNQIVIDSDNVTELVIESPSLFTEYVNELMNQVSGIEGKFILDNDLKEIDFYKSVEIVVNPLSLDFSSAKIQKKLYSELLQISQQEKMYLQTLELKNQIYTYMIALEVESGYDINVSPDIDMNTVFKASKVTLECEEKTYFERLVQYIKVLSELLHIKVIVFVNLRSYLNEKQLQELMKEAKYLEIALLLIECIQRPLLLNERLYIIDLDGCEIC